MNIQRRTAVTTVGNLRNQLDLSRRAQSLNTTMGGEFTRTYTSFSGADIVVYKFDSDADIREIYEDIQQRNVSPADPFGSMRLGNLQGISWIVSPNLTVKGSLICAVFDRSAYDDFNFNTDYGLLLHAGNQYGQQAVMGFGRLRIENISGGISIDDILNEEQLSFSAQLYLPWRPVRNESNGSEDNSVES